MAQLGAPAAPAAGKPEYDVPANQTGRIGIPVSLPISTKCPFNGACTWDYDGLPTGVSGQQTGGPFSFVGTPEKAGVFTVIMTATPKNNPGQQPAEYGFTWTIVDYDLTVKADPADSYVRVDGRVEITLSGTPLEFDSSAEDWLAMALPPEVTFRPIDLPGWLTLRGNTIAGTPTDPGVFSGDVEGCFTPPIGPDVCAHTTFVVTVYEFRVTVEQVSAQQNVVGDQVAVDLLFSGARYVTDDQSVPMLGATYLVDPTGLPDGVSWNSDAGAFVGTVTTPGSYPVTVKVCIVMDGQATGVCGSAEFVWDVSASDPADPDPDPADPDPDPADPDPTPPDVDPTPPAIGPTLPNAAANQATGLTSAFSAAVVRAPAKSNPVQATAAPHSTVRMLSDTGTNSTDPLVIAVAFILTGAAMTTVMRRVTQRR